MKRFIIALTVFMTITSSVMAIFPFYKIGEKNEAITIVENEINEALKSANYEILGSYNVANNKDFQVIVFTNTNLKKLALSYSNRGALAAAQKIALIYKDGKTSISLLNPKYMFHAYFQKEFEKNGSILIDETNAIKSIFTELGYSLSPFGGEVSIKDLRNYKYMIGMPDFNDPVKLNTYASFEEGLKTIRANLEAKKGNTVKVYELISEDKNIAVFGVGLLDVEEGEKHFLSIIGEDHLAAMPYEIILQDNEATMLHGRFRIALFWPELSMSTFTKIMSTPGKVEEFMEAISK
ncbi:MAG: hypothetical protein GQ564_06695 [Bacteroidales bacterium]|nr:hypothetical protein [Bacteroidales bacterium]